MTALEGAVSPLIADPLALSSPRVRIASPPTTPPLERRRHRERRHGLRRMLSDAAVVSAASAFAAVAAPSLAADGAAPPTSPSIAVVSAVVWWACLAAADAHGVVHTLRPLTRVALATATAFAVLAVVFALVDGHALRAQLLLAAPLGLVALVGERLLREGRRGRRDGAARTLLVGSPREIDHVSRALATAAGRYAPVGSLAIGADDDDPVGTISASAARLGADAVVLASAPADDGFVRALGWRLEGTAAEIVVASRLADITAARISLHAVDGVSLVRVRIAAYQGGAHILKRVFDVVTAVAGLVVVAVAAPVIAAAILIDSGGPVLFRQQRVGRDGRCFRILKFRTMTPTADLETTALAVRNEAAGPLFKLHHDPRVTRVGRVLRRHSLDELPQFWNVLVGDMSIVGPRPPLPQEVLAYDAPTLRRLYVKPGITGPWQVGGRSDLDWDSSVRIDLDYVENWSLRSDLHYLWRTLVVVARPNGAY